MYKIDNLVEFEVEENDRFIITIGCIVEIHTYSNDPTPYYEVREVGGKFWHIAEHNIRGIVGD